MKNIFLIFLMSLCSLNPTAFAWTLLLDGAEKPPVAGLTDGIAVLESDAWSRRQLADMVSRQIIPVAWLNVSQLDETKDFSSTADPKTFLMNQNKKIKRDGTVRFYFLAWKRILIERIREIAQKGFRGLLLTGIEEGLKSSNYPLTPTDMAQLIESLSKEFKAQLPDGILILHGPPDFITTFSSSIVNADGLLIQGLWHDDQDSRTPHRVREKMIKTLKQPPLARFRILTLDFPRSDRERRRILQDATAAGFDPAFRPSTSTYRRSPQP